MADATVALRRRLDLIPSDRQAFDALVDLFTANDDHGALARLYEQRLEALPDAAESCELLRRLASIYEQKLGDSAKAVELLERLLARCSEDEERDAVDELIRLYETEERWAKVAELLQRRERVARDEKESASLGVRLGDLERDRLDRPAEALGRYLAALEWDPGCMEAADRAWQLATSLGLLRLAVKTMQKAPSQVTTKEAWLELGAALVAQPWYMDAARLCLERAKEAGATEEAQKLLTGLDELSKTWKQRVRELRAQTVNAREKRKAARGYLQIAQLHALFDEGTEKVVENLDRVFMLNPADPSALEFMEEWFGQREDYTGLVELLERFAASVKDRQAAARIWLRIARLKESRLGDRSAAADSCKKAIELEPSGAEAAELYVSILEARGEWEEVADALERRLAATLEKDVQRELRLSLARIYQRRLNVADRAKVHLEAAFSLNRLDVEAATELEPLLRESGEHEKLVDVLEARLLGRLDDESRRRVLERLAELQLEQLQRPEDAAKALTRALALEPENEKLQGRVAEIAISKGNPRLFARTLGIVAGLVTGDTRISLLMRLAGLFETDLSDSATAAEIYREILESSPNHAGALSALERTLEKSGSTDELTRALESKMESATGAARRDACLKLAAHHVEQTGRLEEAVRLYQVVLEEDEGDVEALRLLADAQERREDFADLAKTLTRLLTLVDEGSAECHVLQVRLAKLYAEHLDAAEEAAELYGRVFEVDPARSGVVSGLESLLERGIAVERITGLLGQYYAASSDWPRHLAMLEKRLEALESPSDRANLLQSMAKVHEEHLVDRRQALATAARAFLENPGDDAVLSGIERLAAEVGAPNELEAVLARAIEGVGGSGMTPERLNALRQRLAHVREVELGDSEGAVRAHKEVIESTEHGDAIHLESLYAVARIAEAGERWGDLADALALLAEQEPDESAKSEILLRLGSLCLKRLGQPERAANVLESALAAGSPESRVLEPLSDALEAAGDTERLAEVLAIRVRVAEEAKDDMTASQLKMRRASLLSEGLGQKNEAVETWRTVLLDRPTDPDARASLEALLNDSELGLLAARALAPAYERSQDYGKLVDVLEIEAAAVEPGAQRAKLLRRIASVQSRDLRNQAEALRAISRAVQEDPSDSSLREELFRAASESGSPEAVLPVLERAASGLDDSSLAADVLFEAAEWTDQRLGNREEAIARHRMVLEVYPAHRGSLETLRRLLRGAAAWAELSDVCLALAEHATDQEERNAFLREAGRLHSEQTEDLAAAAAAFRKILETDPSDLESAKALERIYGSLDRPEDLAWVLQIGREQAGDGERQREFSFRLAELWRKRLGREDEAFSVYKHVLDEDPRHPSTRQALDEMVSEGGELADRAMRLLDEALAKANDHRARANLREKLVARSGSKGFSEALRAEMYSEIRSIQERDMEAAELAFMTACRQLADGVAFDVARAEAERLAEACGTQDSLCEVFEEVASELSDSDPRKRDLLERVATLRTEAGYAEEAIAAWKKVQALAPTDTLVLEALEKLYQTRHDAADLVDVYRKKVDLTSDQKQRTEARLELARLLEQTGKTNSAIDMYEIAAVEAGSEMKQARRALEQLERLHTKAERWKDLARVLVGLVKLLEGSPDRMRYLLRLGELFEEKGADLSRAVEVYGAILEEGEVDSPAGAKAIQGLERLMARDEQRVRAATLLEPVYRQGNQFRQLVEVLEARLTATRGVKERLAILEEIAVIYEESLGQKPLAFMVWCRAFRQAPEDRAIHQRLETLAGETEGWEELASVYEDELERPVDVGDTAVVRGHLHRSLSDLYENRLGEPQKAVMHQRRAFELDPADLEAGNRLVRLLENVGAIEDVVEVRRRLAALVEDPEEKRELWTDIARTSESALGDRAGAVKAWREVLETSSDETGSLDALAQLARLYEEMEEWGSLCDVYEKEIASAESNGDSIGAAELLHSLGRIRHNRIDDLQGAVEAYARCLELNPYHPDVASSLEALMAAGSTAEGRVEAAALRAAAILEPRYAEAGDSVRRIAALDVLASSAEEPQERTQHLVTLAEIHQEAGNDEMAFMALARAMRCCPDQPDLLERLRVVSAEAELEEEEASLLEELLPLVKDDTVRASYLRRYSALQAEAGEVEEAMDGLQSLLRLVPNDEEALDRLAKLNRLEGDHASLVEVLRRQLSVTEDEAKKISIMRQLASLQEEKLADAASALEAWREVLQVSPNDREALARVDAICLREERWADLEKVLIHEASVASEAEDRAGQVGFLFRLADLRIDHLQDPDGAMDLYREILDLAPGHPNTVSRLEELQEKGELLADVSLILEAVYRKEERWDRLLSALERRVSLEQDRDKKKEILWEIQEIHEKHLDSPDMAFLVLCRSFNEDPAQSRVREALERLADVTGQHEELAVVYEEALDEVGLPEVAAKMRAALAWLHEERLHAPERALELWEQVIGEPMEDPLPALQALDRLYRRKERWPELANVLERQAELLEDAQEKGPVLLRLGQLYAGVLDHPDRAAHVFESLVEIDPTNRAALRGLEGLYERAAAWEKLVENLERQLEVNQDAQVRERLTGRLAKVVGDRLGDVDRAIDLWLEILKVNKRSDAALDALETLYEKAERWEDLAALLRDRLEQTVDPREVTRLSARLSTVLGTRLGEAEDAVRNFKSLLERDPRNEQALMGLREIYEVQHEWEELVVILKRLASLQDTPEGLRRIRFRLTEVLARELVKKDEALEAARRFLDIQPHENESLRGLEEILEELGAEAQLVKVMETRARLLAKEMESAEELLARATKAEQRRFEALGMGSVVVEGGLESAVAGGQADTAGGAEAALGAEDDLGVDDAMPEPWDDNAISELSERVARLRTERVQLLFDIGRAHGEKLLNPTGGAPALEEVITIQPDNRNAYAELRMILESARRWGELSGLLDKFLPYAEDSVEQKAMLVEMATLQEQRLGQQDLAFMTLGRAFFVDPADDHIESEILRLAGETDSWEEVADVLEQVAESVEGPRKADLLLKLAEVQDSRLDDADEAETVLRRALEVDPGNQAALDALAGLFSTRGNDSEFILALEQKVRSCDDLEEKKTLLGRIAGIQETRLSDAEAALGTWERVLDLDGGDSTTIDALIRLYGDGERWDELIHVLERAVESSEEALTKARALHRLAEVFEERLQDDERAIENLRSALDLVAGHSPSMEALERIYTRLERWNDLLEIYEAQVELIDEDEQKIALFFRLAGLEEETFERPLAAIDAVERVLTIDSGHGPALEELSRLLRKSKRWERLIEILEARIDQATEHAEAIPLMIELAEVWDGELKVEDDAERIYRRALDMDAQNLPVLRRLGELLQRLERWIEAVELIEREIEILGDSEDAVELHQRMGDIHGEVMLDLEKARACHARAIEMKPTHTPSLRALKSIAEQEEDWDQYLDFLIQEARSTEDPEARTRLLCQAGTFLRDDRGEPERALELFEEALESIEDDLEAAEAAAILYFGQEGWDKAEPLLTIVCQKYEEAGEEPADLCRYWYKLAYVRRRLGDREKTLEAFRRAYHHDVGYLPALEGLGAGLVEAELWEEALGVFESILAHHQHAVTDLEIVEYYWQIGEINSRLGHDAAAIEAYEKALNIDPSHEPSLSGIIRRLEAREQWDDAIEYRHRLLDLLDSEEKYEMFLAIGRLAHEKLEDPYQAIDAYLGASRMRPDELAPLDSLRSLYRETRQSAKRADVLQRLIEHPDIQSDRAKLRLFNFRLAELLRDELGDVDGAVRHFDDTLDIDYTFVKAFEAIEALLSRHKRWTDLEQAYVRMIRRIPKTAKTHAVRMGLWRTLGEFYRQVLRSQDGAIAAYQVVAKGDPEDAEVIETLAGLLAEKPGAEMEALEAYHKALTVTSEPVGVARAMLRLYSAQKSYDKAYTVAAVINELIGDAQPDEETLYRRLKPFSKDTATRSMSDRLWEQYLYHEKIKGPVAEILAIIYEQAGAELAVDIRELGLNPKKDKVDPSSSMLFFVNIFKQVGQVLAMDGVSLYQRADQTEGLAVANTFPASLVASEEMMGRSRKKELWFNIAKALSFTRPELAIGRLHNLEEIELILFAAVTLVMPNLPAAQDPRVQRLQRSFQRALPSGAMQGLSAAVSQWRPDNMIHDLRAYAEGVEHTANRTGILLCGDIGVAKACLMEDKGGAAKLPLRSKVRELVMFCLSEEYFTLRESLGLAVDISKASRSQ